MFDFFKQDNITYFQSFGVPLILIWLGKCWCVVLVVTFENIF